MKGGQVIESPTKRLSCTNPAELQLLLNICQETTLFESK